MVTNIPYSEDELQLFARRATLQIYATDMFVDEDQKILNEPKDSFSGCFLGDYILSVSHGFKDYPIISAFVSSIHGIRHQILSPSSFGELSFSKTFEYKSSHLVDFFFSRYDKSQDYFCEIKNDESDEVTRYTRIHFDEILEPNLAETYYFGGLVNCSIDTKCTKRIYGDFLFSQCSFCGELDEQYDQGSYCYRFEIPWTISSFKQLEGCSGAPIFNNDGKLVSLICGGWENTPYIYGVNLSKTKPIIDLISNLNLCM